MVREWPDPDFIAETKAAFPDKGIANAEEARVSRGPCIRYLGQLGVPNNGSEPLVLFQRHAAFATGS
jgi:hypothetical protein